MSVLVDPAIWPRYGRLWCHLASDTSHEELHAFAAAAGLPPRGFHRDHYDVPEERRDDMLRAGAQSVSSRELVRRLVEAGLRRRPVRASRRGVAGDEGR